jgi:orotidine-5'-phosphate decarboxylase
MTYLELYNNIIKKRSFLCVGLDPDSAQIPDQLKNLEFPLFEFNKRIIDATAMYAVAYKPNTAFYEAEGAVGWRQLEMTVDYLRKKDQSLFVIADAKRGDIGNSSEKYAKAFFEKMDFDAVTLSPYMGKDSIMPFLQYSGKWAAVLALTSNISADDFETLPLLGHIQMLDDLSAMYDSEGFFYSTTETVGFPLFKSVIEKSMRWGNINNIMYVVGATRPQKLAEIRIFCPNHFFLVPGVGSQGGTIAEVAKYGMNKNCGLLVNISRDIIYAGKGKDFADAAASKAAEAAKEMSLFLKD